MNNQESHKGQCFCGAVHVETSGAPVGMGYCHCESCRSWSAGPINAFTLWPPASVHITQGEEFVGSFSKTPKSIRKWCKLCGGHLLTEHPGLGLTDVYAATLPDLIFEPGIHVHYQETRLPLRDGLPKMRDMPAEMGGSGVAIPE